MHQSEKGILIACFPERSAYAKLLLGDWPINFIFLDTFDPKYF